MRLLSFVSLCGLGLGAALAFDSSDADACGGTFCDSGPQAMPVDQTGENILFVMDGTTVEAHVQIQYTGDPMRFAWVVPMPAVPQVEVGSQLLFQDLLGATVPTYGFSIQRDVCGDNSFPGAGTGGSFSGGGGSPGAGGEGPGGPTVVFQQTVGTFEVTALQGGTAEEVSTWLEVNGYQSIPSAPAILSDYVNDNFVFVAIKLTAGAGIDEIHPLVFRYVGNEPCVPLKLTAVAARENMGVRAFFLGDDRFYPTNYKHVELNPIRLDWSSFADNYDNVVTRAVDSPIADGHAFVTEYAGSSQVVSPFNVYSELWDAAPFASALPEVVIDELNRQGLSDCFDFYCEFYHPLVLPLLRQYLPAPADTSEAEFYGCLTCFVDQIDQAAWDGAAFAANFQDRIVDPGQHASTLLDTWPYLTRLYTTISPAEMTEDPLFHARPDLSGLITRSSLATQRITCCGGTGMILPDGREVGLLGSFWPPFSSAMPYAEKIEEVPLSGASITLVDNAVQIDEQLTLWNESRGWPETDCGTGGAPSGSGGSAGRAAGGSGGSVSGLPRPFESRPGNEEDLEASGCACSVPKTSRSHGAWAALAGAAFLLSRRRDRARP